MYQILQSFHLWWLGFMFRVKKEPLPQVIEVSLFSSSTLMVLVFILKSLTHLEFILVYSIKYEFNFFEMASQLSQYYSLNSPLSVTRVGNIIYQAFPISYYIRVHSWTLYSVPFLRQLIHCNVLLRLLKTILVFFRPHPSLTFFLEFSCLSSSENKTKKLK